MIYEFIAFYFIVERVALGQEETAPAPAPFEWDPNNE
jgi:hypothetical protein